MEERSTGLSASDWSILIACSGFVFDAALVVRLFLPNPPSGLPIGIAVGVGAMLLAPLLFNIRELNVGKSGLVAKLEYKVEQANLTLDKLVVLSMSEEIYGNLTKIAKGRFGSFYLGSSFARELAFLSHLGYIEFIQGGLDGIPSNKDMPELSAYVRATDLGRQFIKLREVAKPVLNA
ncbi:MAG TPA: hypothetical protein VM008_06555 [Phycisphaerae bacterium]|nr:hypothetical protein [Phycisphaerae bacterium]